MNTSYDTETGIRSWLLERWWQKALYVIGIVGFWGVIVYMVILALAFVIGAAIGGANSVTY